MNKTLIKVSSGHYCFKCDNSIIKGNNDHTFNLIKDSGGWYCLYYGEISLNVSSSKRINEAMTEATQWLDENSLFSRLEERLEYAINYPHSIYCSSYKSLDEDIAAMIQEALNGLHVDTQSDILRKDIAKIKLNMGDVWRSLKAELNKDNPSLNYVREKTGLIVIKSNQIVEHRQYINLH